jgi:MFS family permease
VIMNCFCAFISPMAANVYFPAIPAIAQDLGVSIAQVNLTLTTYMIFQGLAPTIFGDFGDAAGRRPAFIIAVTIFVAANIGLALQRQYVALLILRMLQSSGSSGTLALAYAVVADISHSAERGKYMGIVGSGLTIGPALGPFIGGICSQFLGWASIFWFLCIVSVVWLIPYVLTVPETGRQVVGNGSIPPQGWNMTLRDYVRFRSHARDRTIAPKARKIPLPNPFHTLAVVLEKDMAMILFYNALLYIAFMVANSTLSSKFEEIYGYDQLTIGLCYLPIGGATMISSIGSGFMLDWNFRRIAKKLGVKIDRKRGNDLKGFPIEKARVQLTYPMLVVGTIAYIGWAWALDRRAHVAVPLTMSFFIGLTVTGSFQIINVLIVDLYPEAPATATAANNLVRCSFGAVAMAVIEYMIQAMGTGWAFTFLALLFAAFSPTLWLIQRYGPEIRDKRMQKMQAAAAEREAGLRQSSSALEPEEPGAIQEAQGKNE